MLVEAGQTGVRRFRARPWAIAGFGARMGWRMIRGRFAGFGTAAVVFGGPVSLAQYLRQEGASTEGLGALLMAEVAKSMPVLSVPLVAAALAAGPVPRAVLGDRVQEVITRLQSVGAVMKLPPEGQLPPCVKDCRPWRRARSCAKTRRG